MTVYIFEGHDMVGKTEIARALARHLKTRVYKSKKERGRWWDPSVDLLYAYDAYIDMIDYFREDIIIDRFHASEYAYAKTFKRFTSVEKIKDIDEKLSKFPCIIIYCYKSKDKYLEDDGGIIDVNHYDDIKVAYDDFLSFTKCHVIRINTDDEDTQAQLQRILSMIEEKTQ